MSWADLDKLQGTKRPDGSTAIVIRDDRPAAAITETRHLSILFAISRVAYARTVLGERYDGKGVVVYMTAGMPPAFMIEAVCAAGGIVFDGTRDHALAKPPELTMLLDGAFCDFAISVKRRFKVKSMRDALEVREIELRRKPVDVTNHVARWTAIYELMALAGEAAREKRPGRWGFDREQKGSAIVRFPLALVLDNETKIAPGRLATAIVDGGSGSLRDLLNMLDRDAAGAGDANRTMPLLYDRRTLPVDDIITETLVGDETDVLDLPVVAYVEDRDEGYQWSQNTPITPALRQRALANLGSRAFEIHVKVVPATNVTLAFVSGDFYASEAILHRPTMKKVEAKLDSEVLLVGVPARGHLIAMDSAIAMVDENIMRTFLLLIERHYLNNEEYARISSEVIVYQGKPIGRVQSNLMDTRRALRRVGVDPDA